MARIGNLLTLFVFNCIFHYCVPTTSTQQTVTGGNGCTNEMGYEMCRGYGIESCCGGFEPWARKNCNQYCGYCCDPTFTNPPCIDVSEHCDTYDSAICTNKDYRIWAEDHCRKFCKMCVTDTCDPNNACKPKTIDNSTTIAPTTAVPTSPGPCRNHVDCDIYSDSVCVGVYAPWANQNCPMRCGYCLEKESCFDKLTYCEQYTPDICTTDKYFTWARRNCRKHCNKCYTLQNTLDSSHTGKVIHPTPPSGHHEPSTVHSATTIPIIGPGALIGQQNSYLVQGLSSTSNGTCLYKGNTYDLNSKWYDGCKYICECFDADDNRMICVDRCSHWNIPSTDTKCKLVQESGECCIKLECTP